jgi:hypothetical protein
MRRSSPGEVLDEDFKPPPSPAGPVATALIRRSIKGPDDRWPTPGERHRWYAYIEDRPIGYLDSTQNRRWHELRRWVPFTMTGGRLSGPGQLSDALDVLLIFDVSGRSPMRVCPVCGRARRCDDPHRPLDFGWSADHGKRCAPIAALFA